MRDRRNNAGVRNGAQEPQGATAATGTANGVNIAIYDVLVGVLCRLAEALAVFQPDDG
jgi:hypothetical protein